MAIITIPKILREKLSEEGAEAIVDVLNKSDGRVKEDVIALVEEKFEKRLVETKEELKGVITELLAQLKEDIAYTRAESKEDSMQVQSELRDYIAHVRSEFKEDIAHVRAEISRSEARIIKWMFIFWVGQFASIVGVITAILFAFFR